MGGAGQPRWLDRGGPGARLSGQIGTGGGGDCSIATSPDPNPAGKFNWAYSGLGPLTNFTVSRSAELTP